MRLAVLLRERMETLMPAMRTVDAAVITTSSAGPGSTSLLQFRASPHETPSPPPSQLASTAMPGPPVDKAAAAAKRGALGASCGPSAEDAAASEARPSWTYHPCAAAWGWTVMR